MCARVCAANASIFGSYFVLSAHTLAHRDTHTHHTAHTLYNAAYDKWQLNYLTDLHVQPRRKQTTNPPAVGETDERKSQRRGRQTDRQTDKREKE